jgi:TonB family protein
MLPKPEKASREILPESLGSLRGCLVEGDAEQVGRERGLRRRALAISIVAQSAVLTALMLVPLFGKTERIALGRDYVQIPPYGHHTTPRHGSLKPNSTKPTDPLPSLAFASPGSRPHLPAGMPMGPIGLPEDPLGDLANNSGCETCSEIGVKPTGPRVPDSQTGSRLTPRVIRQTNLDPGMLLRRIEPAYPTIAVQIHREGRVELHALIGTDGNIHSLEVVSGDPLFLQSALQAVQQWHYKPTYLNGQAVEIDTYITVVYTLQH